MNYFNPVFLFVLVFLVGSNPIIFFLHINICHFVTQTCLALAI